MLKTLMSWLFITLAVASSLGQTAPRYGYVLAPDQKYVVVDLVAGRVVGSGNLAKVNPVGYFDLFASQILLQGIDPTEQTPDPNQRLALLTEVPDVNIPRLNFARWQPGPTVSSSLIWTKVLRGNLLAASWQDEQAQTTLYDAAWNIVKTIGGLHVTPTSCLSSDGETMYVAVHNSEREIKTVKLRTMEIKQSSYGSVGNPAAFYKAPKAADGCVVAFIERMDRATAGPAPAKIYLHDLERNRTLNEFTVAGDGRFALLLNRKLLLHDLTVLAANKQPNGTTVGLRRVSPGTLLLYDTLTGKETGRISVPPDGVMAGVSSDGQWAYHLSPNLLTIIDLANKRLTAKVNLPFRDGVFVPGSEKQAGPPPQPQSPPSSRKGACGCYACGVLLAVDFPNKSPDCAGILATDACPQELATLPDKGMAYCKEIKKSSKNASFGGCPALAKYCDSLNE